MYNNSLNCIKMIYILTREQFCTVHIICNYLLIHSMKSYKLSDTFKNSYATLYNNQNNKTLKIQTN